MLALFNFPVWVFVNHDARIGWPHNVLMHGGSPPPHAPFPVTLPVYSTEAVAQAADPGPPFAPVGIDKGMFCEILENRRPLIENVVLDIGTPAAVPYPAEELRARLCRP
jgi:hypothetical protein